METQKGDPVALKTVLANVTEKLKNPQAGPSKPATAAKPESPYWRRLLPKIGSRYVGCRFKNYEISTDETVAKRQRKVVDTLREYLNDLPNRIREGNGIFLYGPAGTGKDHLLVALMHAAAVMGVQVEWVDGVTLFEKRRDGIQQGYRESEVIERYTSADVLAISDPLPPWGSLSEGRGEYIFRIVDSLYRQKKPVWITTNVSGSDEASDRLGEQVLDRLRDGATALYCNWPSYRKSVQV